MKIESFYQTSDESKADFIKRIEAVAEAYGEDRIISLSFAGREKGGWWAYLLVK